MTLNFEQALRSHLKSPLPGYAAHAKMIPPASDTKHYEIPADHKEAAVLLALFQRKSDWYIIYMKRSSHIPEDKHSGQISFPGGKYEDHDADLERCAIRETVEELGISEKTIDILGALSPIYVYVSGFVVYPYVAVLSSLPEYELQESEVAQVYEVPLSYIMEQDSISIKDMQIRNTKIKDVPYIDIEGETLWGATAMITSELTSVIQNHLGHDV